MNMCSCTQSQLINGPGICYRAPLSSTEVTQIRTTILVVHGPRTQSKLAISTVKVRTKSHRRPERSSRPRKGHIGGFRSKRLMNWSVITEYGGGAKGRRRLE